MNTYEEIEATDCYFDEVNARWVSVPSFWVGDFVASHTLNIRNYCGRLKGSGPIERQQKERQNYERTRYKEPQRITAQEADHMERQCITSNFWDQ